MKSRALLFTAGILGLTFSSYSTAFAQTTTSTSDFESRLEVHGFASQGFLYTPGVNWLRDTKQGSFNMTEVGLNVTKPISERFTVGFQLFTREIAHVGNFDAKFDWFYARYKFSDSFGVQFGRIKVPFGLYNPFRDIDSARLPVFLPNSVYPIQNRDYILAQTGFEAYGNVDFPGMMGDLEYRVYAGTIPLRVNPTDTVTYYNIPYVVGTRLLWDTPAQGLRIGGSLQFTKLDTDLLLGTPATALILRAPVRLWVASAEYARNDWLLDVEYSQWHFNGTSTNTGLFPNTEITSERAYAMASRRVNAWLYPGIYYSIHFRDMNHRHTRENQSHDLAATFRFDINQNWMVKLEGHIVRGTADVDVASNGGTPRSQLNPNWGIFVMKTTAYF